MGRNDYASTGIGVLKTMLGTYILIIAGICYAASRDAKAEQDPVAIVNEAQESYRILSYNGKVFAVNEDDYEAFKQSGSNDTVLIDALDQEPVQTIINKNDIEELTICSSYDEAVNYITSLNDTKTISGL